MLIVHPTSSCDVCLEPYGTGSKSPHSISCGHVFCLGCLDSITSGACPLCRDRFHPLETRKLHIDLDSHGATSQSKTFSDESSQEARRLQDSIARIVKDGSSEPHLRALIEECSAFLKTQTRAQHEDLRVSFRMISYLCDVKSSLKKQVELSTKLELDHETFRSQSTAELDAAERKYQDLLQSSSDERETALAVENSLREHYKVMLMRCKEAETECERLSQELECLRRDPLTYPLSLAEEDVAYRKPDDIPFPTDDDIFVSSMADEKLLRVPHKEGLYLSPLPEHIDPLPSSLKSFVALPEVDYEFEKTKDMDHNKNQDQPASTYMSKPVSSSMAEPLHLASEPLLQTKPPLLRTATDPIPVDPHVPKVSSGLALTAPPGPDMYECEPLRLKLRIPDREMSNPSPSHRSSRHSSPSPFKPSSAVSQQSIQDREHYSRDRGRSFVLGRNEPEQLRSQLHDLLSNPVSSSLPNISHFPSVVTVQPQPSSPPSRSASIISQRPPPITGIVINPPTPTVTPPNAHSHGQRPVISHASSAALALEKERQKAEKERQKDKERQKSERDPRRQLTASASSNSLREPSNAHSVPVAQSSNTRRDLTNIYGTGTTSGSSNALRDAAHGLLHGGASSLRDTTNAYAAVQPLRLHQSLVGKRRLPNPQSLCA